MLRSMTEFVFAPHCSQPGVLQTPDVRQADGRVGGKAVAADRAEELVAADPEGVETAEPSSVLMAIECFNVGILRRRRPALRAVRGSREEMRDSSREGLVFRDVVFVTRRGVLPPLRRTARTRPQKRVSRRGDFSVFGLRRQILENSLMTPCSAPSMRTARLVLKLSDVARRAVQSDHLGAGQLRARERDADRQAVRIALVPAIRKQAERARCCR